MCYKEKVYIGKDENGLVIEQVDEDGVQIWEAAGGEPIYLYVSEIPDFTKKLWKIYDYNRSNNNNNK